jgi:hypothetical protein
MVVRPYRRARDNRLEMVCLLVLLYAYFASVLVGAAPNSGVDVSVVVAEFAIVAYGLWRMVAPWVAKRSHGTRSVSVSLELPLLDDGMDT